MQSGDVMKIDKSMQCQAVMQELGRRCKQYRIAYPLTQAELSEKSMVSLSTIKRFENGEDIGLSKLIQLMAALDMTENLEILIPDQSSRPSAYIEQVTQKQRVRKKQDKKGGWKWGDEE